MLNVVIALILGLIFGSFFTMLTHRSSLLLDGDTKELIKGLSFGGSRCSCGEQLKFYHLIPVLSYLFQKGKASCCRQSISIRYPIIEVASALLTLLAYYLVNISEPLGFLMDLKFWLYALFFWGLLVITVIDFETMYIPDRLSYPILWAGLLATLLPGWQLTSSEAIISVVINYMLLWLLLQGFLWLHDVEALGYGDLKLSAAIGAWIGYEYFAEYLALAGMIGIALHYIMNNKNTLFPFGPALSIAGLSVFVWRLI